MGENKPRAVVDLLDIPQKELSRVPVEAENFVVLNTQRIKTQHSAT